MTLDENRNSALERAQQWYAEHGCVFLLGKVGQQLGQQYDDGSMGPSAGGWAESIPWRIVGNGSDGELKRQYEFLHGHSRDFAGAYVGEQVYKLEAMD